MTIRTKLPPAPYRQPLSQFTTRQKEATRTKLGLPASSQAEAEIEPVAQGSLLELGQVHAGILDIQARLGLGQTWASLSPAAAVAIGTIASGDELQKGANAEMLGALQSQISSATLFSSIIWAPAHFTYLEARRASTSDQWQVYHQDSLPAESGPCWQAAGKVARAVGILPAT